MSKKKVPQINESEYIKVEPYASWINTNIERSFCDKEFYRIIDFYVLHSPCKVSSYSPKTLESLGWKNPWRSSRFRFTFDGISNLIEDDSFIYCKSKNHFLEKWESLCIEKFNEVDRELAVIVHAGESNMRMDLFHHIRNAFAHGRFTIKIIQNEQYYLFEDVCNIKNLSGIYVTARICLKKVTLISWIDFLEKKSIEAKELYSLYQ